MKKAFVNAKIYFEGEGVQTANLVFDDKILSTSLDGSEEVIELPADAIVVPGFIDQHIHGAGGADAMDGTIDALTTIANTVAGEGTTAFLATTMTQSVENITNALSAVKAYKDANYATGAEILGIHLEGPFIAASMKGAQPLEYVVSPDIDIFDAYNKASGNNIKIVSLAPEVDGADALIAHLDSNGIVASIGHTAAKSADVRKAIRSGAKNITHTYNAQSALHHREIGVVGSAMLYDELATELIADTIHVSVPAMQLLAKNKPNGKLILITDAMRAKGLADGESELGGQVVIVKNGEARLTDGTLAGSVLRMNRAIANFIEKVGIPFTKAIDCATINPAKALGVDKVMGSIKVGKLANFTVLNSNYDVLCTIRNGEVIYKA